MQTATVALQALRNGSPSANPPTLRIVLRQGETASYAVTLTWSDDANPVDLTAGQVQFAAARRVGAESALSRQLDIVVAANGTATLEFASSETAGLETGNYVCDVWFTDADGNRYPVTGLSTMSVLAGIVTEGLAVTVLPSQEPLARGPGADGVALGDLQVFDGADWQSLTVGVDDQVLTADSGEALGVKWAAPAAGASPASTVTDVASTGVIGVSALYARGDHVHAYHPPNCLYFPTVAEGGPTHVDFGSVYAKNTQFGQFFFEAWLRWDSGQYFVSDGYGGGHALLIGVTPGTGTVAGNFWDSGSIQTFASEDVVEPGEWFHAAVGYNGVAIEVYINGVPCGRKAYTGQRWSSIANWYVGGSDHQNFYGAIATMRLLEGYCPTTRASFRPDRFFGTKFGLSDAYGSIKWMADFTKPATIITDHGITGAASGNHPGRLCSATVIDSTGLPLHADPVPYWIYDENCPVQTPSPSPSLWGAATLTPPSTPVGARFFDSFSRADQTRATPASEYVGLGTGEATGTLGALTWVDPGGFFGIFKGRVFIINLAQKVYAYVENSLADMDVSVDRRAGTAGDVGLVVRYIDANNYTKVWYHNSVPLGNGGDNHIRVSTVVGGINTGDIINAVPTASFTTLRCRVKTSLGVSTYTVWTDGNQIGTATSEANLTGTKAGLYTEWYTSSVYANAHGRMDNFTIYATP